MNDNDIITEMLSNADKINTDIEFITKRSQQQNQELVKLINQRSKILEAIQILRNAYKEKELLHGED